ncbi:MAG: nucleoid-associated protein [Bacteroidales bacterium]|jgi:nucleoid-associated protein YejK|nr:nucleoid-associated protein [Bacteroidales bacterium]
MAKKIRKIGHNINLQGFVVHKINKIAGERNRTSVKLAKALITPADKERRFIAITSEAYYKKSAPTYGIFDDLENNKFRKALVSYNKAKPQNFYDFSCSCMKHYDDKIKDVAPATGGFIVFAHYSDTAKQSEFVLVLAINNKDGYVFNEDKLTIEDIKNIDLNKIDFACQINITKWNDYLNNPNSEIKTYLSLIKGNKELSIYFMNFIGSANKTTNTESSRRLANALEHFCKQNNYTQEQTLETKNKVSGHCKECIKEKREISLVAISALIDIENPTLFQEFASGEEYAVDEIISGDPTVLNRIGSVKYKDKEGKLTIEFSKELLLDKRVIYDDKKQQLTIKNISLSDQITN